MQMALAGKPGKVKSFTNEDGEAIYHVVSFSPSGFVVVSADDALEPVVAFSATGRFEASEENPLYSLLQRDLSGRIRAVRSKQRVKLLSSKGRMAAQHASRIRGRWEKVLEMADDGGLQLTKRASISDVRVPPLLQSTWGQSTTVTGLTCFNYYTPNNYLAGCVATMMAQLMRYHRWPASGVGSPSYTIWVDGVSQLKSLRGGNGSGGAYNWNQMPRQPDGSITLTQRRMIGSLVHDAGVSVSMAYTAQGSGSSTWDAADELVSRFGYGNSVKGYNGGGNIGAGLTAMINPNLNAGLPVFLAVRRESGGHAIVCDGYGYQGGTLYHHVNMGWSGIDNAWYNLPDIDAYYHYTSIDTCVYNIYKTGGGEIISGRVTDTNGVPMPGVTVLADSGTSVLTDATDANGLYAITHAAANTTYTVAVTNPVYAPTSQSVLVGRSSSFQAWSGNRDNIDFELSIAPVGNPTPQLDSLYDQVAQVGSWLQFTVTASDPEGHPVTLSMPQGPLNSLFSDQADGTGDFSWLPDTGDVGEHRVDFVVSDGALSATGSVTISVASLTLTAPTAADIYRPGDPLTISWSGAWPMGTVNIELWQGSNLVSVLTNGMPVPLAAMTWETTVPLAATPSDDYWVYIEDADTPADRALSELFLVLPKCAYDYDGDGRADLAVFRKVDGRVRARLSMTGKVWMEAKGWKAWKPAVADYDGDGKADLAWYVPAASNWRIYESSRGYAERWPREGLGVTGDLPVPADYDGDGKADPAVSRKFDGRIRVRLSTTGKVWMEAKGHKTWKPAVADYDGDGKADLAWYVPSQSNWRIYESSQGYTERLTRETLGLGPDRPVNCPLNMW
ncbi:MAG: hypothetical protein HN700_03420 [Verrucomicrobia bacterium]|nr:hypothetical protein [Verrucomicrobiota bacterium]